MSLVAPIKDGVLQQTSTAKSLKENATKEASNVDKDQFLQMLVAEMKYQDPLEPTSNTEWISQYATFSELEQMQNMVESTESSRANDLVGKTVIMKTKDGAGDVSQVQGRVDYVVYEDGEAMLSIDEALYSIKDLYMTVDDTYLEAYDKGLEFSDRLGKLPKRVDEITLQNQKEIEALHEMYYEEMNDYQKSFIASDSKKLLDKYYEQLQNLIAQKEKDEAEALLKVEEAAKLAEEAAKVAKEAAESAKEAAEEVVQSTQPTQPETSEEVSEEALDQLTEDL